MKSGKNCIIHNHRIYYHMHISKTFDANTKPTICIVIVYNLLEISKTVAITFHIRTMIRHKPNDWTFSHSVKIS